MKLVSFVDSDALTPKLGEKRWLGCVYGCAPAFVLKALSESYSGLLVYAVKNNLSAAQLSSELEFLGVEHSVFPDWETLPYDPLSPDSNIVSARLGWLNSKQQKGVLIVTLTGLAQRIAPPSWFHGQHFDYQVGQKLDLKKEALRLVEAGYKHVDLVDTPGELSIRGALMDVFLSGQEHPMRIELFDDEIESIRYFEPESQRTLVVNGEPAKVERAQVLPAHELPLTTGIETFRQQFSGEFSQLKLSKVPIFQAIVDGSAPEGLENYLPLFFEPEEFAAHGNLYEYLPKDTVFLYQDSLAGELSKFESELSQRFEQLGSDIELPQLEPKRLYLNANQVFEYMAGFGQVVLSESEAPKRAGALNLQSKPLPELALSNHARPFKNFERFAAEHSELPILIVCESKARLGVVEEMFNRHELKLERIQSFNEFSSGLALCAAPLDRGLLCSEFALITENELFHREVVRRKSRQKGAVSSDYFIKSVHEMLEGDPVVHIDHGVGRYAGLERIDLGMGDAEFIKLMYADEASVYVPVANLNVISKFSGDKALAPLHKLGSEQWSKAKEKALKKVFDVAAELLEVQAMREAKPGISFTADSQNYDVFVGEFEFEETPDQLSAIESVRRDMAAAKPMDRLVCGDVGFGKTEVAMRAAFIAVDSGFQVAVLVPTTLLAEQHEESFKERFNGWPFEVAAVTRFTSKKQTQQILENTKAGKVDVLIGTHRLLQDDVEFSKLGLMIVDEEHRFGVRHKEKIKRMSSDVDMLTLTATPIPRTLNMSLSGMRDLSIIATPPMHRLATKTFILPKSENLIKEAVLRELLRGGQVYYVHNDINSIERVAENIRELVPEAKVAVAHGQMPGRELEAVMERFYRKKANVLVCTTIVETGIDVASANTILIERADKFGLAQLHQLRGRVGRSHHQGYAYLLVPSLKGLKGDAKKRLKAIERANALGSGFILASEDLEIRGAGELLGAEQSGNMQSVGMSLYMDYLKRATKALTNNPEGKPLNKKDFASFGVDGSTQDINLHASALFPDEYMPDVHQRLLFYRRLSESQDQQELLSLRMEVIDRFGSLPLEAARLFDVQKIRLKSEALGMTKVDAHEDKIRIGFAQDTRVDAMKIIQLVQGDPSTYRMDGASGIQVLGNFKDPKVRAQTVLDLCDTLETKPS